MSRDAYEILPGALIVSDAHYGKKRPQLLSMLQAVSSGSFAVPQLILMGDIFDLLFGQVPVTHAMNRDAVQTLRSISQTIPVLYLEGNHDYNLSALFPEAHVVPLKRQPFSCRCAELSLLLAHGDFNQPIGYRVYTAFIRNRFVLTALNLLNRLGGNGIIKRLERYLDGKDDCYVMEHFEAFVQEHLAGLDLTTTDVFIEGHYHQGRQFDARGVQYINLDAFACNRGYAIVRCDQNGFTLTERVWEGR
jgi:UDP-2,3-diacylglucosamine hydrolase